MLTAEAPGKLHTRTFIATLVVVNVVVAVISSLGAPLIPVLAQELDVSIGSAQWALTGTLLVAAVASPFLGRLGDGRHRKQVVVGSLVLVAVGGVLAASGAALSLLIAGRALQGIGMALMPLTMAAARDHLPAARAKKLIPTLAVVGVASVGLGYPLTGFVAQHMGVWSAYWLGAGLSAAAAALAFVTMPSPDQPPAHRNIDFFGAALIGLGLVALLLGVEKGPDSGWGSRDVLLLLAAGLVLMVIWVMHELATTDPLVDIRLLRHRPVLAANATSLALALAMYLSMMLISQVVQLPDGPGASVFVAGLVLLPLSVSSLVASTSMSWLEDRLGARPIVPLGALVAAGAALFFALTPLTLFTAFITMAVFGIAFSYTLGALPGLIVGSVPPHETSSALGFNGVARLVGSAVGAGAAVTLARAFSDATVPTAGAFQSTSLVAAGVAVVAAAIAWWLPEGSTVSDGVEPSPL